MKRERKVSRRRALKLGAAAATLPLVHIRTAGAAGKLAVGFWDHWIPKANDTMTRQVREWADKNKVEVTIDYITSNGTKIQITQAAEAQAGTGHDTLPFYNWEVQTYADKLEPVDDDGRLEADLAGIKRLGQGLRQGGSRRAPLPPLLGAICCITHVTSPWVESGEGYFTIVVDSGGYRSSLLLLTHR